MILPIIGGILDFVGLQCDPSIVGETSANLYVQTTLKTQLPSNGFIKLTLPPNNEVSIQNGSRNCSITGDVTQSNLVCSGNTAGNIITAQIQQSIQAGATIQLNVVGGFKSPSSSAETASFILETLNSDGITILDSKTSGITLIVQPDSFTSASITQIDNAQVGQSTSVLVSIRVQNQLLSGARFIMTFPKWNPIAPTSQQLAMVADTSSVQCTPRTNVNANISCSYDTSSDTLRVTNAFPSGLTAGTQFQFVLARLRNPLSFSPVSIQIQTTNSIESGIIDKGTVTITASTPAAISSSTALTTADDSTVQTLTNFRLEFVNPLPLNTGTIVNIVFPSQFNFDSKLSIVQGFGLFGSIKNLNFSVDESQRSIKVLNGIDSYKASGIKAILIFQQLKMPSYVRATDSISVYLTDANGFQIAQITSGITFTPTNGLIDNLSATPDSLQINQNTKLVVKFQPKHSLTTASILAITLPSNLDANCTGFKAGSGFSSSIACQEISDNNFQFTSVFSSSYSYSASQILEITFANVINPPSSQKVQGIMIATYERVLVVGGLQNFMVDLFNSTTQLLFTAQPSQFLSQNISVGTNQTYTSATFTFNIIPDNQITRNGLIKVVIPSEIAFLGTVTCTGIKNIAVSLSCTQSGASITITNGFASGPVARAQSISFSMSGMRTPLSTKTSSSFSIYSMDSSSNIIDQITSLLTVTMLEGKPITSISAATDSNVVAALAMITLSFKPPVPLQNTDLVQIDIPDEITPPIKTNLNCQGEDSLNKTVSCDINGQYLTLIMGLKSSPSKENSAVLTAKFKPAKNPLSTKPISEFQMLIKDANGYIIAQSKNGNGGKFQIGAPQPITNASMTALDNRQQAFTTITINFTTNNFIPAGGYLEVAFSDVYFEIITDSTVKCTSNLIKNDNVSCEFPRDGTFLVKNIFPSGFPGNQVVDFTINNVLIDVKTKMTTPSWTVTTLTPDGFLIDRVSNILVLNFACNAPCLTCLSNNPNFCLTCNSATNNTIFYNNKCLDKCPDSLYYDQETNQCKPCDPKCKTCSFDNPSECTSCNIFNVDYAYLDGATCTNTCSYGYFANTKTAKCEACASPCESCSITSSNCSTCLPTITSKFQYNNKCYDKCPNGFIAQPDSNNICVPCDSSCQTCVGMPNYCTTCKLPLLLSEYDNTCVSTCPFGKTIYNSVTKICERCDQTCNSCSNKTTFCTSCVENLNLWPTLGTCKGECSSDKKFVGFNGVCTACSTSCVTCVNKPDSCSSCTKGLYLYDYTCVESCPSGYEVDLNSQCVIKGLRCPFGQEVNPAGTACVLKVQVCEDGNVLNAAKDRCVPKPGNIAPFPLCFACLFMSIIIIVSWIKFKETLIVSNVIAVMSIIETIGILVQMALAYEMGVYSTFGLSLVAILFLYGCNLFFTIVFLKQVSTDSAFKYWGLTYKITQNCVIIIGSVINFKFFRVIYARFYGKDHFNAAFDDPEAFFKPFTLVSVFSIVTTMLPILVANIIGLVSIEFGYQVQMCCIELTIIELVMLGLMIYEKIKLKKYAMKQHQYYKVEPKFIDNAQVNVMSSIVDEQTNMYSMKTMINPTLNNSKTNKTEENLLTLSHQLIQNKEKKMPAGFKEYYERRRLLEKLISRIYQKESVIMSKGQNTVDLIAKLQEEEILRLQERYCKSYRDLRELDDDFADQGAGDPELQNFISAPTSPREKEMLHNPFFMGRVAEFKKAMRQRDQYDNCYAEGKPAHYFPMRDTKLITVKVQTNLLELLAIDDMTRIRTSKLRNHDSSDEEYIEENLNRDYAQGLIDDVLDTFKEHQFTKQRRRLPKARLAQIPNFDLSDIVGDFDIDDNFNNVIIRGKDGKLNDREGRKVNKRGYLIDNEGNIITTRGVMIFRIDELDSDEEIPAPFCFEKKKESLFKIEGIASYSKKVKKQNAQDQEDEIEREYRKLRQKNDSHTSSVDSLMGETPSKYNKKNKRVMPGDEDGFLSKIVQPMQAKTKSQLLQSGNDNIRRNAAQNIGRSSNRNQRNPFEGEATRGTQDSSLTRGLGFTGALKNTTTSVKKSTSIGGYDTSIQDDVQSSAKDLFFSSAMGNQTRTRQGQHPIAPNFSTSFMSRSNQNQYQSQELAMQMNQDRINKINELKETLGANAEDKMLLKSLAKFESNLLSRAQGVEGKSSTLAKKNLQRVYGKVKSKMSEDYQKSKRRTFGQSFFEEDGAMQGAEYQNQSTFKQRGKPPTAANQDSRLKNLENIYIKNLNQDRKTASQLQRQKNWAAPTTTDDGDLNFTSGGPNTAKHKQHSLQDTGVESSDQDEIRMRKQLNKMQAIIDKGQKISNKTQIPKANKKIFDGGWI